MNEIVNIKQPNIAVYIPEATENLIKSSIAENTRKAYQRALGSLTVWLKGRPLTDALLANYITEMHRDGKSPATIGQLVAAVKWQFKHQSREMLNLPITQATLAGIRRDGKGRGRGQVDGLIWQEVETGVYPRRNRRDACRLPRRRDDPPDVRLSVTDF